jgi:hypothetical protein
MSNISKSDVLDAIKIYVSNNDRPCPAHYLTDKFGDDVSETILTLKKEGSIIGKRGRNGGIIFPDAPVNNVVATPVTPVIDHEANELLSRVNAIIADEQESNDDNDLSEDMQDDNSVELPF